MTSSRDKFLAYGAWAAICVFWGTTYLGIRVALETLPPFLMGSFRFLVAGSLLFVFMRFFYGAKLPNKREWFTLSVLGVLLLGVGNGVVTWTEQYIPSGMTALLVATFPFWAAGLEGLRPDGERLTPSALIGMLLGFAGLALLVAPHFTGANVNKYFILGVIALQVGCLTWTIGSIYAKYNPISVASLMGASMQMLSAGVVLGLAGTLKGEWSSVHFSGKTFAALTYLIVFGSIVAFSAYNYAIQKLPLSFVSMYSYINPVIAVILGWVLLSEPLNWQIALATTVILCGVALVKSKKEEKRSKQMVEEIETSVDSCTATG